MYSKSNLQGVFQRFKLTVGSQKTKGSATISAYHYDDDDALYNLRAIRDGNSFLVMYPGDYVRLHINGHLFMSDTNMERLSSEPFVYAANGRVLMAGLGIGLVLENLIPKIKSGQVSEIVVVEKNKDVIELVAPYFSELALQGALNIINDDIFTWKPAKGEKFDAMFFDIWGSINTDNLAEINKLHRQFRPYLSKKDGAWMDSWLRPILLKIRARERREERAYY